MPPGFGRARITRRAASGLHDRATRRGATAVTATTDGSREPPDAAVTAAADPDRRAQPYGRAERRLPDRRTHDHTLCGVPCLATRLVTSAPSPATSDTSTARRYPPCSAATFCRACL